MSDMMPLPEVHTNVPEGASRVVTFIVTRVEKYTTWEDLGMWAAGTAIFIGGMFAFGYAVVWLGKKEKEEK